MPCQTSSSASNTRWVAAQSGCQSSGQPSSDCRLPAIVTLVGPVGACGVTVTATSVVASSKLNVTVSPVAEVNGTLPAGYDVAQSSARATLNSYDPAGRASVENS